MRLTRLLVLSAFDQNTFITPNNNNQQNDILILTRFELPAQPFYGFPDLTG